MVAVPPKRRIIRTILPERETAVAVRLREARQYLRLSQAEFASQVGLTRESLASVEDGRVAMRLDRGLRICRQFIISEQWLACGVLLPEPLGEKPVPARFGNIFTRLYLNAAEGLTLNKQQGKLPFSRGFEELLSTHYSRLQAENTGCFMPRLVLSVSDGLSLFQNSLQFFCDFAVRTLGEQKDKRFLWALVRCGRQLHVELSELGDTYAQESTNFELSLDQLDALQESDDSFWGYKLVPALPGEIVKIPEPVRGSRKKGWTDTSRSVNNLDVRTLAELLAKVKKLTAERGRKSDLARALGVPLASISQWLSGAREPGGETTLRLLQWVELQERK